MTKDEARDALTLWLRCDGQYPASNVDAILDEFEDAVFERGYHWGYENGYCNGVYESE